MDKTYKKWMQTNAFRHLSFAVRAEGQNAIKDRVTHQWGHDKLRNCKPTLMVGGAGSGILEYDKTRYGGRPGTAGIQTLMYWCTDGMQYYLLLTPDELDAMILDVLEF